MWGRRRVGEHHEGSLEATREVKRGIVIFSIVIANLCERNTSLPTLIHAALQCGNYKGTYEDH